MSLMLRLTKSYEGIVVDLNSTNTLTGNEIIRKYMMKRYTHNNIINLLFGL